MNILSEVQSFWFIESMLDPSINYAGRRGKI